MDGTATLFSRRNDDICGTGGKNIHNTPRNIGCATYPRHPLVLAQQALSLHDLVHGRLRLGIGPSHRFIIEDAYGLHHKKPLDHLQEYVKVLREALWEGKVDHHGHFYNVVATSPRTSQIPLIIRHWVRRHFSWPAM